eukprot:gnl/MRDRNA2_/MRDRNA2_178021_c0_seq1.p1 gnl/MRDRNA2_/MRDRNA2_178021_c0~~gnl/MRDRNA2_/MRDRNA2_178021_c0_seq1.p1  ORF type:complete len:218 (+),score=26.07 gnl/MRDRNA2_/MRDRNA2_178021_c0_seq1:59-712(+)
MPDYVQLEGNPVNRTPMRWRYCWAVCCSMLALLLLLITLLSGISQEEGSVFHMFETHVQIPGNDNSRDENLLYWPSRGMQRGIGQGMQWLGFHRVSSSGLQGQHKGQYPFLFRIHADKSPDDESQNEGPSSSSESTGGITETKDLFTTILDAASLQAIGYLVIALMLETYSFTNGLFLGLPDPTVPVVGMQLSNALLLLLGPSFFVTLTLAILKGTR